MRISDWSSDVCSSDLGLLQGHRCVPRSSGYKVPRKDEAVQSLPKNPPALLEQKKNFPTPPITLHAQPWTTRIRSSLACSRSSPTCRWRSLPSLPSRFARGTMAGRGRGRRDSSSSEEHTYELQSLLR